MTKWESRTEDLGFFPKNEVAFLAFLAFSLLKPMQNGFFLLGFLPKKPCSPYIKYSMAFLAFTWLFPRGKSQGKSRSYPYLCVHLSIGLYTRVPFILHLLSRGLALGHPPPKREYLSVGHHLIMGQFSLFFFFFSKSVFIDSLVFRDDSYDTVNGG